MAYLIKKNQILSIGIVAAFNLLIINYLYGFNQGLVNGGNNLRLILKLSILIILYGFGLLSFRKNLISRNFYLIFFFVVTTIIMLVRMPFNTSRDIQFLNNIFSIPFLLGSIKNPEWFKPALSKILIFSVLSWTIIDWSLFLLNLSVWENKAFIGGMGNPSTYGLLLIFVYTTCLTKLSSFKRNLISIILVTNLFLTQALMPILIFLFVVFLKLKKKVKIFISIIIFLSLILFNNILEFLPDYHWKYKLESLILLLSNLDISDSSASIYTRLDFFSQVIKLFESPNLFLFGNINGSFYNSGDSMFVTYLTSFGFPLFLVFIIGLLKSLFASYKTDYFLFMISCVLMMITNRILDYWPIAILIYMIINLNQREINKPISLNIRSYKN